MQRSDVNHGGKSLPADLWAHVIESSATEHDVVLAVREYLAQWSPEELARLPAGTRPGKITDGEDITDLAYRLSRAHLDFSGPPADTRQLERMMSFMGYAGAQVSRICAMKPDTSRTQQ